MNANQNAFKPAPEAMEQEINGPLARLGIRNYLTRFQGNTEGFTEKP